MSIRTFSEKVIEKEDCCVRRRTGDNTILRRIWDTQNWDWIQWERCYKIRGKFGMKRISKKYTEFWMD